MKRIPRTNNLERTTMTLKKLGELAWQWSVVIRWPVGIILLVSAIAVGYLATFILDGEIPVELILDKRK